MLIKAIFTFLFFLLVFTVSAQNSKNMQVAKPANTPGKSFTKEDDIRKILQMTGSADLAKPAIDNIFGLYKQNYPNVPSQVWDDFSNAFKTDQFLEKLIPVYDKYYSHAEIKQLIAFYKSPVGQKTIKSMPSVMQQSMAIGQTWEKKFRTELLKNSKLAINPTFPDFPVTNSN